LKAKIRGIYSTALTKLLMDHGFKILQPSKVIKERFNLPSSNNEPPEVTIKDRSDLQGIVALGSPEAVNFLQTVLQESLEDVLTRKWSVSVDGIYKGTVVKRSEKGVYVDIGNGVLGLIPGHEAPPEDQKEVIVQVERKGIGRKIPLLTTRLKIVGKYAILIQGCKVGVSLKIQDANKRVELCKLGKELSPENWGIIWREPAAYKPKEFLEQEIAKLSDRIRILSEKASSKESSDLILEGLSFMNVEFPCSAKKQLDELRSTVTPTIKGHHFFKSCGGRISAALEMAEKLLEKGGNKDKIEQLFREQIQSEFPEKGALVDVEHVKPSGVVLNLGKATIEALDAEMVRYHRTIRADGVYDGLGVEKKAGDKAVSEAKPGEWYIITNYFSSDASWKGAYININTPIEVYPKAIRYIDLEVDICVSPSGEVKVLDMEKLQRAYERGILSGKLFEKVGKIVKNLLATDLIQNILANFI